MVETLHGEISRQGKGILHGGELNFPMLFKNDQQIIKKQVFSTKSKKQFLISNEQKYHVYEMGYLSSIAHSYTKNFSSSSSINLLTKGNNTDKINR